MPSMVSLVLQDSNYAIWKDETTLVIRECFEWLCRIVLPPLLRVLLRSYRPATSSGASARWWSCSNLPPYISFKSLAHI